ncbi:MAG: hypothetical protein R3D58_20330 [Saprospiraceae bacterium]|jgi:hypothetical protein|nr:hypothetical protein [Lewinellaceae bacterium]
MVVAGAPGLLLIPQGSAGLPAPGCGQKTDSRSYGRLPFWLKNFVKICQKHRKNAMASILTSYLPGQFEKFAASMTQRFFWPLIYQEKKQSLHHYRVSGFWLEGFWLT